MSTTKAAGSLGIDYGSAASWFNEEHDDPYVLVRVTAESVQSWVKDLGLPVRRCYVSDSVLVERAKAAGVDFAKLIAARLPDPGSTMAGDFGEILVYFYQGAQELPAQALGPKKWRLKQDRTKPAPHSDVVHFVLPCWPAASSNDVLLCSEVKTKSTAAPSNPIQSAIDDSVKDRTSRLARTLVWLRERAMFEAIEDIEIAQLNRFIDATEHPAATHRFRAVAVICQSLVDAELKSAPIFTSPHCSLVVIAVPDLKATYSAVFDSAFKAVPPGAEAK